MPTNSSFRDQIILYDKAVTDLYRNVINNFKTHRPIIQELNLKFFQLGLK